MYRQNIVHIPCTDSRFLIFLYKFRFLTRFKQGCEISIFAKHLIYPIACVIAATACHSKGLIMFLYCLIAYGKFSRNKRHVHTVVYSIFLSLLQIRNRHGIISTMLIDTAHQIVTEIQSLGILRCLCLSHQIPYYLLSRDKPLQFNEILHLGIRAVIQFLLIFRS